MKTEKGGVAQLPSCTVTVHETVVVEADESRHFTTVDGGVPIILFNLHANSLAEVFYVGIIKSLKAEYNLRNRKESRILYNKTMAIICDR